MAFWRVFHLLEIRVTGVGPQGVYQICNGNADPITTGRHLFECSNPLVVCDDCAHPLNALLVSMRNSAGLPGALDFHHDALYLVVPNVDFVAHDEILAISALFSSALCVTENLNMSSAFTSAQFNPCCVAAHWDTPRMRLLADAIRRICRQRIHFSTRADTLICCRYTTPKISHITEQFHHMLLTSLPGSVTRGLNSMDPQRRRGLVFHSSNRSAFSQSGSGPVVPHNSPRAATPPPGTR